ncbi:hypothetical protein LTR99_002142 [Exophiala xenobiotica]|nr:hypothetical protein LTR99_002142 [Exophiala xenobiotica]KAK5383752.1 hypothetical protein LTR11_002762 [Exophiala xenobiotica]KAK5385037.1 hypothetical protein LTS03_003002 [Exophiala xenobiotica]KAK5395659.1 hypothetical protein LTR79_007374 [Exophiala xenobiotica]
MGEEAQFSQIPPYIDRIVDFDDGKSYELLQPLTTFRHCHDGTPPEARMVFVCRQRARADVGGTQEYVVKVKIRVPARGGQGDDSEAQAPEAESSTTTRAELKALKKFRGANTTYAPLLVNYKQAVQGSSGPLPGGYMTFTVMTKMPGDSLHNLYFWGMAEDEREEIVQKFLVALRSIYTLGIEPVDCALRNVLWERETKRW